MIEESTDKIINKRGYERSLSRALAAGMRPEKVQDSLKWLSTFFKTPITKNTSSTALINNVPPDNRVAKLYPGFMYCYKYQAITPNLPYYDKFPLIFPFAEDRKHFWGINLHYAPPAWRAKLFVYIKSIADDPNISEKRKSILVVSKLRTLIGIKAYQPLIKCYLKSQVQSKFIRIDSEHWEIVMFLPTARFTGTTENKVFNDFFHRL